MQIRDVQQGQKLGKFALTYEVEEGLKPERTEGLFDIWTEEGNRMLDEIF